MKQIPWRSTGAFLLLGVLVWAWPSMAIPPEAAAPIPQDLDHETVFDVNSLEMFVSNQGSFAFDIGASNSGLFYPKGTANSAIFAAGLWVGAKVNGQTRVTVNEYSFECIPGVLEPGCTWDTEWGSNPHWRTYKINRGDTAETNEDYAEWPSEDGAPVDSAGAPLLLGDQTLWCVYHDGDVTQHTNNAGKTDPLGLEIQQTTFGFNLSGPLENVIFLKFLMVNKCANTLEDTFISLWSDPDLGGAGDDYVGCDTTLSLGYTYNATNRDLQYGGRPPAVGMDFFQGPIVPSEGDTATVSGQRFPGYRNLPMTSFNKYINGTDPKSAIESYNYMQGLAIDGSPVEDPVADRITKFVVPGDPTAGARGGWIDTSPADRRMMLSSGPFDMVPWVDTDGDDLAEPGEPGVQEVVSAVVIGQARDRLTAITALKFNDQFAQFAFDNNFDLPSPPPAPQVTVAEFDGAITLHWGDVSETEYDEPGYAFEGYNVYQLASPDAAAERKLIATYDVNNGTAIIFDDSFDLEGGVVVYRPVQFGTDSGLDRSITIREDEINGGDLRNGKEYYFLVTAYSYNPEGVSGLRALESSFIPHTVVPQPNPAGIVYGDGIADEVIEVDHVEGLGQLIFPQVVAPRLIPDAEWVVTIDVVDSMKVWSLTRDGVPVVTNYPNVADDQDYPVIDGILWRVAEAPSVFQHNDQGVLMLDETKGPGGVAVPPDGTGGPGRNVFHQENSTGDWELSTGGGPAVAGTEARFRRSEGNLFGEDIIMRFDGTDGNYGYWAFDDKPVVGPVPFSLWTRDPITMVETRMIPELFSNGTTPGVYDYSDDNLDVCAAEVGCSGSPTTDWLYGYTGDYDAFKADIEDNGVLDESHTGDELFSRLIFASADKVMPAEGTELMFPVTHAFSDLDRYVIRTQGVTFAMSNVKDDLKQVRVVPNPYRNQSVYELNAFSRRVKFTHLPEECTIRIFNLAGDLIRTIDKEPGPSSVAEWDLLTANDLPVASGVYIYHVEAKEGGRVIGSTTGKMAVFMEKERLNTF